MAEINTEEMKKLLWDISSIFKPSPLPSVRICVHLWLKNLPSVAMGQVESELKSVDRESLRVL